MPQEHRCQQQQNTKTTTGNICDAVKTSWMQAIARKQWQGRQ
jgi:hypothetical protein